ncbi:meiosis-specific kinetochore protein isoform X1 [Pitangus sulphuratus]|nr:meiosis-specific kinetochore protein isoform X1 [Pitangus sulphuratus]
MERDRAPRAAKAPRKKRRESPLPGLAALPGRRAGPPQPCRRSLFGSAGPESRGLKKKVSGKALPKIKENVELTDESPSCNQSNQVNVRETRDLEKEEEESEESNVSLKKSSTINIGSKENLQNAEMTSGTEMTLPTGVSTFLIECLDVDSTADSNNTSGSLQSYSSPETFRDDDSERSNFYSVDLGKYKNSTLLDSSKAVTIDKIAQLSNLSAILGKKLYKITAARERTPDLESGMRCASPLGPDSKPDKQTAKPKRLKRKKTEHGSNLVGEGSSSFRQLDAPGNTSARSGELTARVVPTKPTVAVVQMTSTMLVVEENKALKNPGNAQLAKLEPLYDREEICSIVRLSPHQRPSRLLQVPVKREEFSLPKGVPEG